MMRGRLQKNCRCTIRQLRVLDRMTGSVSHLNSLEALSPSHLAGPRMSHLSLFAPLPVTARTATRLSAALLVFLAIGLSGASPAHAQWVARSQAEESATSVRPRWSPYRPSAAEVAGNVGPTGQDRVARGLEAPREFRPLERATQASHMAEGPAFEAPEEAEEIPTPAPAPRVPARMGDPRFQDQEPYAEEGLPESCDDNDSWCNPRDGRIDFQCQRLFDGRLWARGEYLLWWTRGSHLPALVTTSPLGTRPQDSGILGRADTSVLFGDGAVMTDARSGGRFTLGFLLLPAECLGVEANYLFLGAAVHHYQADNTTVPILARPYFDLGLNAESALLVSHPDFLSGSVSVDATTDLQGAGVLMRKTMWQGYCERLDFLLGYRYVSLQDGLEIRQISQWTRAQGIIPAGTTKDLFDSFDTQNQFNGGDLGLAYRARMGQWSMEILGKAALGSTSSQVQVDGVTTTTLPDGQSATFVGGLLAQETNIGAYRRNQFAVIPECNLTLGYNLTPQLRATAGYTFIYWSKVLRAGDQIDRSLSQLPPEPPSGVHRPIVPLKDTDFWAQGINLGLDYCF
jgi:hypothetical protein